MREIRQSGSEGGAPRSYPYPCSARKNSLQQSCFFVSRATSDPSHGVPPSGGPDRLKPGLHAISPDVRVS